MQPRMDILKLFFYTGYVLAYIVQLFLPSEVLEYGTGLLALGCLALSFRGADRIFQIISVVFLTVGTWLFQETGIPWHQLPAHMNSMGLLLALLYVLPWVNHLIAVGRYDQQISRLLKNRVRHLGQLYWRSSLAGYLLCIFLFFGSIPLVHRILQRQISDLHRSLRNRFVSRSVLRAFAMATVWSPIEVFIAVVTGMTGVGYTQLLPWLLFFSLTLLLTDWAWGWRYRKIVLPRSAPQPGTSWDPAVFRRIGELILALFLLIGISHTVHRMLDVDFFAAITLVMLPFTMMWSLVIGQWRRFVTYSGLAWKKQVLSLQNLMLLFLALGFFNEMFFAAGWLEAAEPVVRQWAETPVVLFVIIQLSSLLLTFIGIHPLVTISLQGMIIQPFLSMVEPVSLALVLLTSNVATDAAGTYNTTVTIMSRLTGENPYRITSWNLLFALGYGAWGVSMAILLH